MASRPGFTRPELSLIAGAAAIVFSRVFAFSLVLPGFRTFGETLTDSDLLIGVALGAYGITLAITQLAWGGLSDRVGRKPVIILGTCLFILGSAWAASANSIETLIAARLIQGLGGVSSVAMAAVGETVPESRRTTAMAMVGIPAGLAFFLGFALGPWAESIVGFRGLFWATAALGIVAILPLTLRPIPAPQPIAAGAIAQRLAPPVAALALAGFAINFGMNEVAFFLSDIEVGRRGLALILLGAFVAMVLASKAIDKAGANWQPIAIALAVLAAGAPLFALYGAPVLYAGGLLFFAAHAILSATLPSQVSRIAGRSGGRGHGIQLIVGYLGSAAGGVAAGALANRPAAAFLVLALVVAAAIAAVLATLGPMSTRAGAADPQV